MAVRATVSAGTGSPSSRRSPAPARPTPPACCARSMRARAIEVLGVAPTGRAARELTEEAGVPARTLDRLLIDLTSSATSCREGAC